MTSKPVGLPSDLASAHAAMLAAYEARLFAEAERDMAVAEAARVSSAA
jgi:hypothetical protein